MKYKITNMILFIYTRIYKVKIHLRKKTCKFGLAFKSKIIILTRISLPVFTAKCNADNLLIEVWVLISTPNLTNPLIISP